MKLLRHGWKTHPKSWGDCCLSVIGCLEILQGAEASKCYLFRHHKILKACCLHLQTSTTTSSSGSGFVSIFNQHIIMEYTCGLVHFRYLLVLHQSNRRIVTCICNASVVTITKEGLWESHIPQAWVGGTCEQIILLQLVKYSL
ncbi:hypothetical protein RDI58_016435 [Solanum bulbocastanum]|uniref:Uncharacterized protein n=1 Tax=Solanum bulbocastanum TaxID=147425 RepID=A0AAN8THG1_SOLBU